MKQTNKNHNLLRTGAVLLLTALWVIAPFVLSERTVQADGPKGRTKLHASLSGAGSGFSDYRGETRGGRTRRRLEVRVSAVNVPTGTALDIFINNAFIGQIIVDNGDGDFRIETDDGQPIPALSAGMSIQIRQGSTIILAGVYSAATASPSPSGSPSGSPSPSASPTVSPTGSPSPSPTATPIGSPSPSPTASPVGSPSPSPSPGSGDFFANLSGAPINGVVPGGSAQYEIHSSRRELEVFVSQVNLPSGTRLTVVVDNSSVGQITLNGNSGSIRLRTDDGAFLPNVVTGSTIQIKNGNTTILSGTFTGITSPSPSPSASPSPSPAPPAEQYFEAHLRSVDTQASSLSGSQGTVKVFLNEDENAVRVISEIAQLSGTRATAKVFANSAEKTLLFDLGSIEAAQETAAKQTFDITPEQVKSLRAGLAIVIIEREGGAGGQVSGRLIMRSDSNDFDKDFALSPYAVGKWLVQSGVSFYNEITGSEDAQSVAIDFDGDGRDDAAVFRPSSNTWLWLASSDGSMNVEQLGADGDVPKIGDFDGDGRIDVAISRPSTGEWFVFGSSKNVDD